MDILANLNLEVILGTIASILGGLVMILTPVARLTGLKTISKINNKFLKKALNIVHEVSERLSVKKDTEQEKKEIQKKVK